MVGREQGARAAVVALPRGAGESFGETISSGEGMLASDDCIAALAAAPRAGILNAAQPCGASWTTAAWGLHGRVLPNLLLHIEEQSSRPLAVRACSDLSDGGGGLRQRDSGSGNRASFLEIHGVRAGWLLSGAAILLRFRPRNGSQHEFSLRKLSSGPSSGRLSCASALKPRTGSNMPCMQVQWSLHTLTILTGEASAAQALRNSPLSSW